MFFNRFLRVVFTLKTNALGSLRCKWHMVPLEIHPKWSGPTFCSYKPRGLQKNMWFGTSTNFLQHPLFCREVFFAIFFISTILNMSLACMLGPCAPKKGHFVRTCSSAMSLRFSHSALNVFKGQPILFVRKWVH